MHIRKLIPVALLLAFMSACTSMMDVPSEPAATPVTIDGSDADWAGKTWYVKDRNASVGFQHTGDKLYVFFKTGERTTQMQILRGGLTVWIDSTGGSGEYLGIRYPASPALGAGLAGARRDEYGHGMEDESGQRTPQPAVRECEVLGPEKDDLRIAPLLAGGIDARYSMTDGMLIYEMQIPLNGEELRLARPGPEGFGIGFATATRERDRKETAQDRMDREQGGMPQQPGAMGGNMPGGMGRRPGGGMTMQDGNAPLELWMRVKMSGM